MGTQERGVLGGGFETPGVGVRTYYFANKFHYRKCMIYC